MKRRWISAEPVDEVFFETAPLKLRERFVVPLAAERVWDDLTCENPLPWCRILKGVEWTSRRPFGVGTTRTARSLGDLLVLHERFFRWEDGRRYSFFVEEASIPGLRRHAEDFLVEPTSESSCRFTWTVVIEPRLANRISGLVGRLILATAFRDTHRHYGSS